MNLRRWLLMVVAVAASACGASSAGGDGGLADSGSHFDAGSQPGVDGGPDAGATDAGPSDAGAPDAGPRDAGPSDAGPDDAGPLDAGPSDAGAIVGIFAKRVTLWGTNVEPAAWDPATHRVIYNRLGADNLWDAYSAWDDGGDERCITCALPAFPDSGANTNRGASDITPDGRYILLTVEKGAHPGTIGDSITDPGRGVYNDLWLITPDGSQAWPLTNLPVASNVGTIWQRFDRTGNTVVWAQMYQGSDVGHIYGYWSLETADIVWDGGVPALANGRSFRSDAGEFYEPYGFSPDNQSIIFDSDMGQANYAASKIFTIDRNLTTPVQLGPNDATGFFADYDEFAYYVPGLDFILYGRTFDTTSGGMDFWTMSPDGSGSQRLTFLNEPWHAQGIGYAVVGGSAFDPANPYRFFTGVAVSHTYNALDAFMVDLEPYRATDGLTGTYFSDTSLTTAVDTRVDPAIQFRWNGAPTPALSGTNFSARWTGTVTAPSDGAYQLCTTASSGGARLFIDGGVLVDDWFTDGGAHCGDVTLHAGAPVGVAMEYWNFWANAVAYLSWVRPDGVRETIPPDALKP